MPADPSITSAPSEHHGNGDAPYPCSSRPSAPPHAAFSINYGGYCRTSLDHHKAAHKVGSSDPRCPADCPHKAPEGVAVLFTAIFNKRDGGAEKAAQMAREFKGGSVPCTTASSAGAR